MNFANLALKTKICFTCNYFAIMWFTVAIFLGQNRHIGNWSLWNRNEHLICGLHLYKYSFATVLVDQHAKVFVNKTKQQLKKKQTLA